MVAIHHFAQCPPSTSKTRLLSAPFFAKIIEGLAKGKNTPYVSPRGAEALHVRL
jgi:hypothetical protein